MKFSDIVKFDSDPPREPGVIKGDFQIAKSDEDQRLVFG